MSVHGRVGEETCALLNPQKVPGSGHSVTVSGALLREYRGGLLIQREKIEIVG
jgi:hypothetical protein